MTTRSIRTMAPLTAVLATLMLLLVLVLSTPAFAHRSDTNTAGAVLMPVGAHDQLTLTGGSCSSCGQDDDKNDDDDRVSKVGSPYWKTYKTSVISRTSTPAKLVVKVNNYSPTMSITESYGYTYKSSLSVGFSGGYANYVKASVGGEYSQSKYEQTTIVVPPKTSAKAYIKYWTEQVMRYGQRLQDYSDGSRSVIETSSGPVKRTWTEKSFMTSKLD